jgi:endonuclease/exonuclease/phosphatase family metal-dependent hydrolase
MRSGRDELSVANFNIHAGIDGWGRPFDVVEACRPIDADVLVLQESWAPQAGPSTARQLADAFGYDVVERAQASGRRAGPDPEATDRWLGTFDWLAHREVLFLDSERPLPAGVRETERFRSAEPGRWGLAVLSRRPILDTRVIDLGRLPRDRVRRLALVVSVDTAVGPLTVVATHMSHLLYASPIQFWRLRHELERLDAPRCVLSGDMNMWGPPLRFLFPGWRRTVRGATWPSWQPHSQLDHVLVRGDIDVVRAEVLSDAGSDHRPVRVRVACTSRPQLLET